MLPPVLEIFVVWHPDDAGGAGVAEQIIKHFRGASFSGVVGGGIHVSIRSVGWAAADDAPQSIYTPGDLGPNGIEAAEFVAIIPLLGVALASELEKPTSPWTAYIDHVLQLSEADPAKVSIFPYSLNYAATDETQLGCKLGHIQFLAASDITKTGDTEESLLCRDLSQGLAQFLTPDEQARLTVFVSHTKRSTHGEGEHVDALVEMVRKCIADTRLAEFFDASDLQPGTDWDATLRENAQQSALLAIRTDLFSSREWCQREVSLAKCSGMPMVTLDAIGTGEERGSFLMDHVPRIPVRLADEGWRLHDVVRGLNLLTDECLKRAVWQRQQELAGHENFGVVWWAPHAPEPLTFLNWLENNVPEDQADDGSDAPIRILHPDPPLGPEEKSVLCRMAKSSKLQRDIDIMTPRHLAARGG